MKFKEFVDTCQARGIKHAKLGRFEIEFFEDKPTEMAMDPVSLSKILTDALPPDSAMLFASAEDMEDKQEASLSQSDGETRTMT